MPRQAQTCSMWLRHQGLRSRRDKPSLLRDILADVPSQDFVDKGLISDAASTCFLAELIEHSRIDVKWRSTGEAHRRAEAADAAHGLQLLRG